MQNKIGETFNGIISGVSEWGIYVELEDSKCEGMVYVKDIKDDKYYDVNTISNGDISSNSVEALSDTEKLSQLYINLSDYEPCGDIGDINLDPPIIPTNVFAVGLNYKKHAEESNLELPTFPMIFTSSTGDIGYRLSDTINLLSLSTIFQYWSYVGSLTPAHLEYSKASL